MDAYFKLHRRLQLFVDAVVETGTAAAAVRKLEYKTKNAPRRGYKLMKLPGVREAVEERRAEAIAEARINPLQIVLDINDTVQRCRQARPVLDKLGHHVIGEGPDGKIGPLYVFDAQGALRGLELLAKWAKALPPERHELTGKDGKDLPAGSTTVYVIDKDEAKAIEEDLENKV